MIQTAWNKQSRGWYTNPHLGDICLEPDAKWWWLPKSSRKIEDGSLSVSGGRIGPFETLRQAKDVAERAPLYDPTKA